MTILGVKVTKSKVTHLSVEVNHDERKTDFPNLQRPPSIK